MPSDEYWTEAADMLRYIMRANGQLGRGEITEQEFDAVCDRMDKRLDALAAEGDALAAEGDALHAADTAFGVWAWERWPAIRRLLQDHAAAIETTHRVIAERDAWRVRAETAEADADRLAARLRYEMACPCNEEPQAEPDEFKASQAVLEGHAAAVEARP